MTEFSSPALEDLENTRDVAALLEAAKTGNLDEVIGQLDGVGTPVDSCVLRFGRTSLHWACEGGHENVCAKLISAQADVNFRDRDSDTPLDGASDNACKEAIQAATSNMGNVRLHDMVEQLVEQNGRLMENQSLLVAEVKRLRGMLGQPVEDGDILEVEQEEY